MINAKSIGVLFVALAILASCGQRGEDAVVTQTDSAADAVYINGKIYTVNDAQPWADAVAIKDGRLIVVGSSDDVSAVTGDETEVVDLGGAFGTSVEPS